MRGPSDVGCAHCKQLGATLSCIVCKLQVCERCADPLTCSEPVGRVMTLGRGARLRAVDPAGRHALVTQPFRGLLLLDIRSGRMLGEVPLPLTVATTHLLLTDDGRVIYRQPLDHTVDTAICMIDARTGHMLWQDKLPSPEPALVAVSPNQKYLCYTSGQSSPNRLRVLAPPRVVGHFEPLQLTQIDAVALDESRDLVASGGHGLIAVHRITTTLPEVFRGVASEVFWLGFAGEHLLSITSSPNGARLERRALLTDLPATETVWIDGTFGCAAVSRDGAHVAVSTGRVLHVIDVRDGTRSRFEEHTDTISYLAFGADHVLIAGDDDRRVIVRPRIANGGYGTELIPLEVADP